MDRFKNKGNAPTNFRVSVKDKEAPAPRVDREAKRLNGIAAISRGEALGHGMWIDAAMLSQVAKFGNANPKVKARFTHPGLSSDGADTLFGRPFNFRVEGDRALADLQILDSAHNTPKGDLATRAMDLAEESPDLVGMSIVFTPDFDAMDAFQEEHSTLQGDNDAIFTSPDELNTKNFPHARLSSLDAVDLVGDPAANATGMFSNGDVGLADIKDVLLFALGIKENLPTKNFTDVHPERIRRFCAETLAREGFEVVPMGNIPTEEEADNMPTEKKDTAPAGDSPPVDLVAQERERASRIRELAEDCDQVELGNKLIDDGVSVDFAGHKLCAAQGKANAEAIKQAAMRDPREGLDDGPGANKGPSYASGNKDADPARAGYEIDVDRVEDYQAAHEGVSYLEASDILSRLDAKKARI